MRVAGESSTTWESLIRSLWPCDEVILFGSRAASVEKATSDWDVLCVATSPPCSVSRRQMPRGMARGRPAVDVVWLHPEMLWQREWLGSELANHIRQYGIVLHGSGAWRGDAHPSHSALQRKIRSISVRSAVIKEYWSVFSTSYRKRHALLLRRDLQRLALLRKQEVIPPTAMLDQRWAADRAARLHIKDLALSLPSTSEILSDVPVDL